MKILGEINRGGFGRVEKIKTKLGMFARKIFDPTPEVRAAADVEKLRRRFQREVKVQSSLGSDLFIPVVNANLDTEEPWFIMPLAERNFGDQIEEDRHSGDINRQALADILNALEELHELGYTHRDLKPANILLHEKVWKLSDFGLVLPPSGQTTTLTAESSAWGTAAYCAPEQLQDFRGATPAADIFAFGCILHDLFDGGVRVPYQQCSSGGAIGLVIEKCTENQARRRFKSIAALRSALFDALTESRDVEPSAEAASIVSDLESVSSWQLSDVENLARFLGRTEDDEDRSAIFQLLDEDTLLAVRDLDEELWDDIALEYCEWATNSSFPFEYCDVLVKRLELIFARGSLRSRAAAAVAAAELGVYHNRWFVMRRLLVMCGENLDDTAAKRIAIEIAVEEAQENFRESAYRIDRKLNDYHETIASVLIGDQR